MVLCFVWMAVIFAFSATPATASSQQSGAIAELVTGFLENNASATFMQTIEIIIRKAAHILEYGVLGALWWGYLYHTPLTSKKRAIFALLIVAVYAASDELHQFFVVGRAARVSDIAIDCLGGIIGISIVLLITKYILKRRKARKL